MRRILAILLLLVLGSGSVTPAAALATGLISGPASQWSGKVDDSRLPACCRRHGKHHCAMSLPGEAADSNGEATLSAKDSCPWMPRALASTAPSMAAIVRSATSSAVLPSSLLMQRRSAVAAQCSERRGWPKRGPPASQLL